VSITQGLSWACQWIISISSATWLYRRCWGYRFGFEEYYVECASDVEAECHGYERWERLADDPMKCGGGRAGWEEDGLDTPTSQIKVFGRNAHARQRLFAQRDVPLQSLKRQEEEMKATAFSGRKGVLSGLGRLFVSVWPLLQRIAQSVPLFTRWQYQHQENERLDYEGEDDGFAFSYNRDSYNSNVDCNLDGEEDIEEVRAIAKKKKKKKKKRTLVQEDEAMAYPRKDDLLAKTLLQIIRNSSWH
jgi:hypothetical protein